MAIIKPLPVSCVNHISILCRDVAKSVAFYENVLGFIPVKRPGSFEFNGAWLFNYGMGIHLIQTPDPSELPVKKKINPKDNHVSFQTECHNFGEVEERLRELGVAHVREVVVEGNVHVEQIFFHDPDGFMIEVCTCGQLPVVPLGSAAATESSVRECASYECMQSSRCACAH